MALLSVSDLRKSYAGEHGSALPVVAVDSFELEVGEQVALQGPSGCGKTTFLHLIAGILAADSGRIQIGDTDVAGLKEAERDRFRAANIGYVFQSFHLMREYTCLENVELGMSFGAGVDRELARSLLKRVGLGDRLKYRASALSVGQQQRVAVARALANRPKLVLADEPTGSLDEDNASQALALIRELCRENGAALILASHDRTVIEAFERRVEFAELNSAGGGLAR